MTAWSVASLALIIAGMVPAVVLAGRGTGPDRLLGVQLAAAVATAILLLMSQDAGQSMYLIVPMALVVLSFAGALVYTRLLAPRRG